MPKKATPSDSLFISHFLRKGEEKVCMYDRVPPCSRGDGVGGNEETKKLKGKEGGEGGATRRREFFARQVLSLSLSRARTLAEPRSPPPPIRVCCSLEEGGREGFLRTPITVACPPKSQARRGDENLETQEQKRVSCGPAGASSQETPYHGRTGGE